MRQRRAPARGYPAEHPKAKQKYEVFCEKILLLGIGESIFARLIAIWDYEKNNSLVLYHIRWDNAGSWRT